MEVRMLAVLNGFEDAVALLDMLKGRVAKYYGTPLTAFLHALYAPGEILRSR
jgi:hypothetical protein